VARTLSIGDEAPNFDLSSTEDVVLMLRDEASRMAQVLLFFGDADDPTTRRDLEALKGACDGLAEHGTRILGISAAKLPALKELQRELALPFPLLRDDRRFADLYGFQGATEEAPAQHVLVLVDRRQRVAWIGGADGLGEVEAVAGKLPSPASNYPGAVVNTLIDRWVN
jgi:peroxiredoxin